MPYVRTLSISAILLGALTGWLGAQDEPRRTWRDITGKFSTEAAFVGQADSIVTLRKTDGATVQVPFEKLSRADRDWVTLYQIQQSRKPSEVRPPTPPPVTARKRTDKWYEGGTLHRKSALAWQEADPADKLATCTDFIAATWNAGDFRPDIQNRIKTIEDMRPYAQELVAFLDSATKKFPDDAKNRQIYTNQTVSDLSIACFIMLRWVKD